MELLQQVRERQPQLRTPDAPALDLRLTRDTAMFIRSEKSRITFQDDTCIVRLLIYFYPRNNVHVVIEEGLSCQSLWKRGVNTSIPFFID